MKSERELRAGFTQNVERIDVETPTRGHSDSEVVNEFPVNASGVAGVGIHDGVFYRFGGRYPFNTPIFKDARKYDPETEEAETLPDVPVPRSNFPTVKLNGKFYLLGGESIEYGWTDDPDEQGGLDRDRINNFGLQRVDVFNAETEEWEGGPPLPKRLSDHSAAVLNGSIHVVGGEVWGFDDDGHGSVENYGTDSHYRLDPETGTWSNRAPLPSSEEYQADMVTHDGKLYLIGGADNGQSVREYDPEEDEWDTTLEAIPEGNARRHELVSDGDYIYAFGYVSSNVKAFVHRYDPEEDEWEARYTTCSAPGRWPGAVYVEEDNEVWLWGVPTGGSDVRWDSSPNGWIDRFSLDNNTIDRMADLNEGRYRHGTAYDPDNDYIFAFAGSGTQTWGESLERYDIENNQWQEMTDFPADDGGRLNLAIFITDEKLYSPIGRDDTGSQPINHYVYDINDDSWDTASTIPTGRRDADGAVIDGEIYVVGGDSPDTSYSRKLEKYNPETDTWEELADMPFGRYEHAATTDGKYLYVAGGRTNDHSYYQPVHRYDPETNEWDVHSTLDLGVLYSTNQLTYVEEHDLLVFVGARSDEGSRSEITQAYDLSREPDKKIGDQWFYVQATKMETEWGGVVSDGEYYYVVGGDSWDTSEEDRVWRHDPATMDTVEIALSKSYLRNDAVHYDGYVYEFPGLSDHDDNGHSLGYKWDTEEMTYETIPPMMMDMDYTSAAFDEETETFFIAAAAYADNSWYEDNVDDPDIVDVNDYNRGRLFKWELGTDYWEHVSLIPEITTSPQNRFTIEAKDGEVAIIGNRDYEGNETSLMRIWDIENEEWSYASLPIEPFRDAGTAIDGDKFYIHGGFRANATDDERWSNELFVGDVSNGLSAIELDPQPVNTSTVRRQEHRLEVHDRGHVYIVGGNTPNNDAELIEVYIPQADVFTRAGRLEDEFSTPTITNVPDDGLYLLGGHANLGTYWMQKYRISSELDTITIERDSLLSVLSPEQGFETAEITTEDGETTTTLVDIVRRDPSILQPRLIPITRTTVSGEEIVVEEGDEVLLESGFDQTEVYQL